MLLLIRYANWSLASRIPLVIVLLITIFFGLFIGNLGMNASPYIVDESHALRKSHKVLGETFTNSGEQVMLILKFGNELFTPATIKKIDELSRQLELLSITDELDINTLLEIGKKYSAEETVDLIINDGINIYDQDLLIQLKKDIGKNIKHRDIEALRDIRIKSKPVHKVRSLSTVENLIDDDDSLITEKLIKELPSNEIDTKSIREQALNNELYRKILIDDEGSATNVQIELTITGDDSPNMIRVHNEILATIKSNGLDRFAHLSGVPVVNAQIGEAMDNDNKQFFPIVIIVILLSLLLTFKNIIVVLISMMVAVLTMIWALGSMAILGIDQNIVTSILPIFLISIAVADSIHYVSAYLYRVSDSSQHSVLTTNAHLIRPMFLTTVTTIIGFFALSYSDLIFIREFGLFVSLGVAYAFFITISILPRLLPKIRFSQLALNQSTNNESNHINVYARATIRVFLFMKKHSTSVFVYSLVLLGICLTLSMDIKVDNHSTASFDDSARIRTDEALINRHFGGIYPVNFWFQSDKPRQMIRPDVVSAIETLQNHIMTFDQVGYSISPNNFLKRINRVVGEHNYALPSPLNENTVSQFFFLYENSSGQDLRDVLDMSYSQSRLVTLFKSDQASQFEEAIASTKELAEKVLPSDISFKVTGYGAEIILATDLVVNGQISSICIAIVLIGGLMVIYFRSFLIGIIGVLPLTLTIIINFTLMSITNTPLDIGTALISGIAFGIGIDYSIHFISLLQAECRLGHPMSLALQNTIKDVARPILINSVSLGLGFLILALSDFASLRQLGYFVSTSMILCALITLSILPFLFNLAGHQIFLTNEKGAAVKSDGS